MKNKIFFFIIFVSACKSKDHNVIPLRSNNTASKTDTVVIRIDTFSGQTTLKWTNLTQFDYDTTFNDEFYVKYLNNDSVSIDELHKVSLTVRDGHYYNFYSMVPVSGIVDSIINFHSTTNNYPNFFYKTSVDSLNIYGGYYTEIAILQTFKGKKK